MGQFAVGFVGRELPGARRLRAVPAASASVPPLPPFGFIAVATDPPAYPMVAISRLRWQRSRLRANSGSRQSGWWGRRPTLLLDE